jgi:cation diffusion facilitator family transporter
MRLLQPTEVQFGTATLIAITGLIVNIVSALLLGHGHSHEHDHDDHAHAHAHARHGNDNNLKSAYVHVIADALTSVLAIAALLAGRYLGWVWLDPVMGIIGAIVIARWAWTLMGAPQVCCWIRQMRTLPRKSANWLRSRGCHHH